MLTRNMLTHRMLIPGLVGAALVCPAAGAAQQPGARDTTRSDTTSAVTLKPFTVAVTRAPLRLENVPQALSVVSRDELQRGRVTAGLDEALAAFPGVLVANRYNYSQDQRISIRGFGARSAFGVRGVKILLDGVPQTLPDGQGQLTGIELHDVDRIEILRGSASSLYGNASGGVISIWTDPPPLTRVTPSARVVAGSYGFLKWLGGAHAPVGRGALSVTASRTITDGYRDHSRADIRRVDARAEQAVGRRTSLTFSTYVVDSPELNNPGALTATQLDSNPAAADPRNLPRPVDDYAGAGKAVTQVQLGATLDHRFSGDASMMATVFATRRDLENPLSFAYIQIDRWAYGARANTTFPVQLGPRRSFVTLGMDAQWQRDDRLNLSPDQSERRLDQFESVFEIGPFAQVAVPLTPRATLTVGGRYDRVRFRADDRLIAADDPDDSGERVMSALSGTAGLTYDLHPAARPYVSIGTSFETPTTTELVNRPDGAGGFNPEVDPQRATNYEVGLRGQVAGRLSYAAAAFYSDVRDQLIPFEVPDGSGRRFFRNAGSARQTGAELEVNARPVGGLEILAAYTHANLKFKRFRTASDTLDGNEIPGVPQHYAHVSIRYRTPQGIWAAVDNTHSSGYFADDRNTARNDAWTVVGLRAGWEAVFAGWQVAPFVGVLNLFDERYVSSVVVNAFGGRYYEPAPPRNVYVGLSLGPAR